MADGFHLQWRGDLKREEIEKMLHQNLDAAAIHLTNYITESFGDSSDRETEGERAMRKARGRNSAATKQERAKRRSKPFGPPNVDTGHLKRNVWYNRVEGDQWVRSVGTGIGNAQSVGYAVFLEFGTRKMLPRPFMRPALAANKKRIREIIASRVTK